MNEENKEKIAENEELETNENGEPILIEKRTSSRKPMYIALAIIGVIVLGASLFWIFRGKESGQPVPAPRTVSFGESNNDTQSPPTGEQTVTLAPEQATRAGIKIETVGETLSSEAASVAATGVVQANAYGETPIFSLVGGVVRRVNFELGENVGKGQIVAVIFSDELASAQSRYLTLQTEAQTSRQNYERAARLLKISPVSSQELDDATAKLKTAEAELEEHHKHHARTIKLVQIGAASREEFEQATTKLKSAEAAVEESQKRYQRALELARIKPASNTELEQAAVKARTSESELAAAKQRLIVLGLSPERVNALRSPSQISSELAVTAPVSGTITTRSVNQNEVVEANKELMKITNLSTVWVIAQIFEKDLGQIRAGSGASVTTDAYPDRLFRGQVTYIDPNISPETRTAQARVELENPGQILKIGQYVNVAFGSMGMAEKTAPVIPSSAVQSINNRQTVFVAADNNPNTFILKTVRLGTETGERYVVLEGLNVGDKIVTEGSFLLRAEWLKQHPAN
ncbi:MAG: efflux RND transporter periplasmic adaptor subunit [Acidobacteriota bacterium]|nr:efflux RND transporter periplasmic adaptor subunit [Acidobacteriota bacterium]